MSDEAAKATERPTFDEDARDRIRRALNHYKDTHGIGVPALQGRIADAVEERFADLISLKTLQRFLSDSHRTEDAFIKHCNTFLMAVAPPPVEQSFADGLAAFLLNENDARARYEGLIGTYFSYICVRVPETDNVDWAPYSELVLSESVQGHYLTAHERIYNLDQDPTWGRGDRGLSFFLRSREARPMPTYTGVFCYAQGPSYYLFMNGFLHSRVSMLNESSRKMVMSERTFLAVLWSPTTNYCSLLLSFAVITPSATLRKRTSLRMSLICRRSIPDWSGFVRRVQHLTKPEN